MVDYIEGLLGNGENKLGDSISDAAAFFKPFITSMEQEGSYFLKPPCYDESTINPDTPKVCTRGSPWVANA